MQFSVLGPIEVRDSEVSLPLGGPRQRSVLALLLLDAGRVVTVDRMVTEIWGDQPPAGARDSLYTYVSNLRGVLGRNRIVRSDGGYRLEPETDDTVDAGDIDAHLIEAHRLIGTQPASAIPLIDRSLSLWRGRPYEGLENLPSVAPEAARLEELRLRALEDRIEAELRTGGTPEAGGVEMLITEHPYRERFWELFARVLYRAGRQADALRAMTRLRRMLADDLGIEPSLVITRLEERILLQDPSLDAPTVPAANLPAPISSFVGRTDELGEIEELIADHRLVTVIGPGGVGKTRLAIEAAQHQSGRFPGGVWFVDLAPVTDSDGVREAVASTLGVASSRGMDPVDSVAGRLGQEATLVVLDNCEQVADTVVDLTVRLLSGAPGLRIMSTSRRSLGVSGEVLLSVTGLETATGDALAGDAERLFVARAEAVQRGFALDHANGDAVSSICRRLDGLPLAIELAAARSDTLSPQEIARHLGDPFRLLADDGANRSVHRSLLASLDWSREMLGSHDRDAFDALGVCEGPFTAIAAAAVLGTSSEFDAVSVLRRLVTASLIQVLPGPVTRYRLLETTRLYARDRLRDAGRWRVAVDRHDSHYRNRCCQLRDPMFGLGRPGACRAIEAEMAEYDVAFDRFLDGEALDGALEMAWPLGQAWLYSGRVGIGIGRLEQLINATDGTTSGPRADALAAGSFLLMYVTRYDEAIAWIDESIDTYRTLGDERGLAYALARRGHIAFSVGDVPKALDLLRTSLETCERIGYDEGSAWPLTLVAQARLWGGDESDEVRHMFEEGRRRFISIGDTYGQMHANMFIPNVGEQAVDVQLRHAEESMKLADRPGADPLARPVALHNLAFGAWMAGDRERAAGLNRLSARSAIETGATISSGMAFYQAGLFAGVAGNVERAAILYGSGDTHFVMEKAPFYVRQLQPGIDAATATLGADRYRELHDDGAAMTIEEATDFLLTE